ncbi:unnamed protein product [Rhizophagus irregularis]|uniref:Uncharacterized protein n=1 Tax=Rhizophagus irregularis TaxID=588596 RepID=A0A915ZQH8_9GLOM|nr:unnamed protein product [Rhizophagus irregularis]CAB4477709.1 unnamed protein product [Rhizophagus irregularis]CAB5373372.1 unnamed protein product [Rhizophagus irregularis]CAB5385875.1 unnamed protein product [Rhizophagus irregularis]CAB5396510.1 unnamed protein product [Rhizophagus irregularis]
MTYEILIVKSVSIIKNVVQYFARIFLGNFYNSSSLKSKNILYSMKRINNIKAERKGCFLGILTKFIVVNGNNESSQRMKYNKFNFRQDKFLNLEKNFSRHDIAST